MFALDLGSMYCSWNQSSHPESNRTAVYEDKPKHLVETWQSRNMEITWVFETQVSWWAVELTNPGAISLGSLYEITNCLIGEIMMN